MRLFEGTPFDRPPECEQCGRPESDCACPPPEPARLAPGEQTARLAVERRKKGKQVTVVRGLADEGHDLPGLLTLLKTHCGAGGALSEATLEIQGNQLEKVRAKLVQLGYRVRG